MFERVGGERIDRAGHTKRQLERRFRSIGRVVPGCPVGRYRSPDLILNRHYVDSTAVAPQVKMRAGEAASIAPATQKPDPTPQLGSGPYGQGAESVFVQLSRWPQTGSVCPEIASDLAKRDGPPLKPQKEPEGTPRLGMATPRAQSQKLPLRLGTGTRLEAEPTPRLLKASRGQKVSTNPLVDHRRSHIRVAGLAGSGRKLVVLWRIMPNGRLLMAAESAYGSTFNTDRITIRLTERLDMAVIPGYEPSFIKLTGVDAS